MLHWAAGQLTHLNQFGQPYTRWTKRQQGEHEVNEHTQIYVNYPMTVLVKAPQ